MWVSTETPDVNGGGGQRRQFHQIQAIRAAGVDLEVRSLQSGQGTSSIAASGGFAPFRAPRLKGLIRDRSLRRQLRRGGPIVIAHAESLALVGREVRGAKAPWLVDFQNVMSRFHGARGELELARQWIAKERDVLRSASMVSTVSEEEAVVLREIEPAAQVVVARNGVDPNEWPLVASPVEPGARIAFFGSLEHVSNVEGLRWFVDGPWLELRRARPTSELHVFGPGRPPKYLESLENVIVRGRVDRLATQLASSDLIVVPIVSGMGARVKFIEALASGRPVVATALGAQGYEAARGYLMADTPTEFVEACVTLIDDPSHGADLSSTARATALDEYCWERTTRPITEWLRRQTGT